MVLGREIDRRDRLTAILVATGVALGSAMLIRHDLKQYTAEACDALLILWMLARLERQWSQPASGGPGSCDGAQHAHQ